MPRTPDPKLSPDLAERLREAIRFAMAPGAAYEEEANNAIRIARERRARFTRRQASWDDLLEAMRHRRRLYHRSRGQDFDERTLRRYMDHTAALSFKAAVDLVLACDALDLLLPYDLLEEICEEAECRAAALIFPGELARIAAELATEAQKTLRLNRRTAQALRDRFIEMLEPYERFGRTNLGREVAHRIKSQLGQRWRLRLNRIYMGIAETKSTPRETPRQYAIRRIEELAERLPAALGAKGA